MRPFSTEHRLRVFSTAVTLSALLAAVVVFLVMWFLPVRAAVGDGSGRRDAAHVWSALTPSLLVAAAIGGTGFAAARVIGAEYRRLDHLADLVVRVSQGERPPGLETLEDGSIGRLQHRITQVAHRMQESIQSVEAEKERLKVFLSDISHQLKTPLAGLRMFYEILTNPENAADESRRREFVDRGLAQIDRMEWLIRSLLTMARLDAGELELDLQRGQITETVKLAADAFREQAEVAGVELGVVEPDTCIEIAHDVWWMREAVSNLIRNALQHTPPDGSIRVQVESTEVFVRISVRDTGGGIEAADLPHVFTRFYQGRDAGAGTGIGLSLTKTIVEHHGGLVSVTSEPGKGSCFMIALPRTLAKL